MKTPTTPEMMADLQFANDTKLVRILKIFVEGNSLNPIEAAGVGDSCLNTTISTLVNRYSLAFYRQEENIINRFDGTTTVFRYKLAADSYEVAFQLLDTK